MFLAEVVNDWHEQRSVTRNMAGWQDGRLWVWLL